MRGGALPFRIEPSRGGEPKSFQDAAQFVPVPCSCEERLEGRFAMQGPLSAPERPGERGLRMDSNCTFAVQTAAWDSWGVEGQGCVRGDGRPSYRTCGREPISGPLRASPPGPETRSIGLESHIRRASARPGLPAHQVVGLGTIRPRGGSPRRCAVLAGGPSRSRPASVPRQARENARPASSRSGVRGERMVGRRFRAPARASGTGCDQGQIVNCSASDMPTFCPSTCSGSRYQVWAYTVSPAIRPRLAMVF